MSRQGAVRLLTPWVVVVTLALAGCGETGGDPTPLPAATSTAPPAVGLSPAPTNAPLASPPPMPPASPPS